MHGGPFSTPLSTSARPARERAAIWNLRRTEQLLARRPDSHRLSVGGMSGAYLPERTAATA
jgi:hypothetical protein